jgi:acetyl-CoA carboxylase carboxyltransferase component
VKSVRPLTDLYDILPADHRLSYDMHAVLSCIVDGGEFTEFQPDIARELLCGHARIEGQPVAILGNARQIQKGKAGQMPRIGGIIYTESAEKAAYFIENANRERMPLLFLQDVSGFMVGPDAEQSGIIRAGARFVEAMATAIVPKLVLTLNHASGAGYYAMEVQASVESMRADYEEQLDAKHAAARGHVDAIIPVEETRTALGFLLRVTSHYGGPHVGPFVLPQLS